MNNNGLTDDECRAAIAEETLQESRKQTAIAMRKASKLCSEPYQENIWLAGGEVTKIKAYLRMTLGACRKSEINKGLFYWDDHGIKLEEGDNAARVCKIFPSISISDQGKRAIDGVWKILDNQ